MPNDMQFGDGLKTFTINGDESRTISFAPSDAQFIRRIQEAIDKLEAAQQKYREVAEDETDTNKVLDLVDECDRDVRNAIDGIFQRSGTSEIIFGNLSTCGMADGMPIWAGFLVALVSECDGYIRAQGKMANPKLDKLLKKYQK